jgi:hypothetical protein
MKYQREMYITEQTNFAIDEKLCLKGGHINGLSGR